MNEPNEGDHVDSRRVSRVSDELHEDVNDRGGDFRELDGARVDRLDEELTVLEVLKRRGREREAESQLASSRRFLRLPSSFLLSSSSNRKTHLLVLSILKRVRQLLLQQQHHILHVPTRHHLQRNPESLPLHLHIVAAQHPQHIHHQPIQHMLMLAPQPIDPIQHDQLDVVVALLDAEVDEATRRGFDGSGVLGEGGEGGGSFVLDGVGGSVEEFEDGSDPFGSVGTFGSSFATDEIDDGELEELVEGRDGVVDGEEVLDRSGLGDVAEGDEGVSFAGGVGFLLQQRETKEEGKVSSDARKEGEGKGERTAARKVRRSSGASGMRCS